MPLDNLTRANPYAAPQQPVFAPDFVEPVTLVTAPTTQLLTLEEVKRQCRLEVDDTTEDDFLADLIDDATDYCERMIPGTRQLLSATYDLPVRWWWGGGYVFGSGLGVVPGAPWMTDELQLPRPPLQSVTSITYYDTAGVQQTLSTSLYTVRTALRGVGGVRRAPNQTWPALQCDRLYPVTVRFVAGYANSSLVPRVIKRAAKCLVSHWFDNRGAYGEPLDAADRLLKLAGWGSYR